MGEIILGAGLLGAAASAGSSIYTTRKEEKAAKREQEAAAAAAAAASKVSKPSVVTQTNTAVAPVTQEAQASEASVQRKAKKRMSLRDTVNTFTPAGLRNTLG